MKIKFNNVNDNKPVITRKGTASPLLEDTNLFPLSGKKTGFSYTAIDADGGAPDFTVSGDDRFEIDADGDLGASKQGQHLIMNKGSSLSS